MKKLTLFLFFMGAMAQGFAADRYWVGGAAANWADATSWSDISSAGASGVTAPTTGDDVFFENGAATVTLDAAVTGINSITFTSSNVTFAGTYTITTNSMTLQSSQITIVNTLTINSALTFSGTNPRITNNAYTNGKSVTLGNGGAFTLTGNSTTNYFTGNTNAYYTYNTTSPLTVYFNPTPTTAGGIVVTKGLITLGNNITTWRLNLLATNSQELILGDNVTLTLFGKTISYSSTLTGAANGGVVNASASGSKFIINYKNATFMDGTKRLFKTGTVINNLEFKSSGYTFKLFEPITVDTLTLTAGTIDNSINSITIAPGGSVVEGAGTTTAPVLPLVTVTPIGTYTYNGSAQGPNAATNTGTGLSYTFSYAGAGNTTYGPSATLPTNVGTYTATATVAADGHFGSASSAATAFSIAAANNNNTGGNITDAGLSDAQLENTDITVTSGELVVNTGKTVRSITVNGGAKLTVPTGQTLTLTNLTLKSDASNTATYKPEGTGALVVNGTTAVEQYLTYTRNYYVSSPVSNAVAPVGYTYYGRYEPGGTETGWTPVSVGAGLAAGKGYIALPGTAGAPITFTTQNGGTLNNGNITIPLTYTPAATSGVGYNLIGNPYPSHLSWTYEFTQSKADTIESSIWYRTKEGNGNSGGWSFVTFNPTTAETVPSTVNGGLIPPMQAFWVLAKRSGSIQFTNDMRSHQTGNPLRSPAAKSLDRKKLRLQVSNGTRADEALIVFDANAVDGYDAYDSPKMMNNASDIADIYTVTDAQKLVINGMSSVKYDTEIPVGFSTLTAGDFNISANEISNFVAGTRVILIDKLNPANEFELTNGVAYHFSAPVTAASTDRFSLLFRAPGVATVVDNATKQNAQVFVNAANQISIIGAEKSNYAIYNAMGQQVMNGVTTSSHQTSNLRLAAGIYVVRVGNQSTRVIIK